MSIKDTNQGFIDEAGFIHYVKKEDIIHVKKLDGTIKSMIVQKPRPIESASGTRENYDIIVNSECSISIKSSTGHASTIINKVPKRNFEVLAKHSLLDTLPLYEAFNVADTASTSKIRLHEHFNKEDWREIIEFFFFLGTATKTCDSHEQSNCVIEITKSGPLFIEKYEAVDHFWHRLTAEIRLAGKKHSDPTEKRLHVRIGK